MDHSLQLAPQQLHVLVAPHRLQRQMMTLLTAHLALTNRVRLVDAGNCFDGYGLARQLRQQSSQWHQALERISVARAFTCYQVETLLTELVSDFSPILVLNLLDTFLDENVKLTERLRLLKVSLAELRRLHRTASVAVSVCPLTPEQPAKGASAKGTLFASEQRACKAKRVEDVLGPKPREVLSSDAGQSQGSAASGPAELLAMLTDAAGQVWTFAETQPLEPMRLF